MPSYWNERYASDEFLYGKEPNAFFKSAIDDLSPGKLLLPGDGEGRNGVYAAAQSWDVTAFDESDVAAKKAQKFAEEKGVSINYLVTDAMEFSSIKKFHAIGLIFFHLPSTVRHGFHRILQQWLKPGGKVILEGFTTDQLKNTSGGPKDESMLFTEQMLLRDFDYLNIERLEEKELELKDGAGHHGKANVIRMIGSFD